MMKKNLILICLIMFITLPFFSVSCSVTPVEPVDVEFSQLMANHAGYNGKNVTVGGYLFLGFEVMALCGGLKPSGYAPGHMIPEGKLVWVEGGIPDTVYTKLQRQQIMGPDERFGKVKVTGNFHSNGHYGHLGGYEYEIVPDKMELISE